MGTQTQGGKRRERRKGEVRGEEGRGVQLKVQCSCFTVHDSQFTIHRSRVTIRSSRFTVHDSQFTFHNLQRERERERRDGG